MSPVGFRHQMGGVKTEIKIFELFANKFYFRSDSAQPKTSTHLCIFFGYSSLAAVDLSTLFLCHSCRLRNKKPPLI